MSTTDRAARDEPRPSEPAVRDLVAHVDGWLTDDQIGDLHRAARDAPAGGRIVEIGSFRGRSTIVLASSAAPGTEVVAIDPHAGNDRGPQEIEGFADEAAEDNAVFNRNLEAAGVADRVRHVRAFSDRAHGEVADPIDVLFVDGAHRFGPARDDLRDWGRRVAPGGTMLVHDAFSSIGVTLAILAVVLRDRDWRCDGRSGSLVRYTRTRQTGVERVRSLLRHLAWLPWFARNVVVKVLLVSGQRGLARRLGHDGETWPF